MVFAAGRVARWWEYIEDNTILTIVHEKYDFVAAL